MSLPIFRNTDHVPLTEAIFYILVALNQPMHGYGITQFVKEISQERVELGPGTLYGAIKSLLEKGWIKPVKQKEDSRRKEYEITEKGKEVLQMEMERLEELVRNGNQFIRGEKNDN
ncbi:PadR family transcriptional regulator [Alkalihalobacterium chitinilyticum]|uniref:Helix-turn-helix transcriptional regulator n=1 Tax=Alkalihalobacterium chitinilyticum TaxID=2980103 RepID=A0ABT5VFU7_9BACI|nr:helix-turn-helix transcriptional regulator [Alkalihalobacterium chitinilyticum]MDE5414338.1 helix-turn-helix transcriptional regulator [Alkalihalobacterium chitinilyticum]